ncbi:MAG: SMC-Scp complex subunit ScpB [Oscillospiraceae bacterium]|uniref:SMC-Scp complex subunit ScpB n=1 Tax=Yanshouia hominis TaxID=2763673 RepID=A0ABR7NGA6_9FIRM|nr:SMC-Scp complex subunit ScpB [Yanshouia hominis]MBS1381398.1 SMC-Scp complex subunit ScpB [Oscillospiraceae bacterium]MCM0706167.1 SMC-Scp complex subunit ScpB [Faecalicatena sp. BF-R-105]MDY3219189.1 SMC-Scp complex subunit ScpB [Candidatus Fimivivens sp.]SFI87257.1 segregation and condensation protein B [Ruminococcaceae bacterium D5]GKH51354.1 segregation and condensation protein B [Eubacteriales bacterium]
MSKQLESAVLAVLFAVGEPLAPSRLAEALETKEEVVRSLLEHLRDTLEAQAGAFQILNLNGQYQLATREEHTGLIRRVMNQRRSVPLSQAALEVLAAVAYNQPVTRAYVEQVRGVDSSSIIASLVEKGLLEEAGRLELPGRPICYQTTPNFLRTFGLSSLEELPLTEPAPGDDLPEDLIEGQIGFDDPGVSAGE